MTEREARTRRGLVAIQITSAVFIFMVILRVDSISAGSVEPWHNETIAFVIRSVIYVIFGMIMWVDFNYLAKLIALP